MHWFVEMYAFTLLSTMLRLFLVTNKPCILMVGMIQPSTLSDLRVKWLLQCLFCTNEIDAVINFTFTLISEAHFLIFIVNSAKEKSGRLKKESEHKRMTLSS